MHDQPLVAGFRCAVCGAVVDVARAQPWHCPNDRGDRHHVLHIVPAPTPVRRWYADADPFVAFGPHLAWWAFARANGMTADACAALSRAVGAEVATVAGAGFQTTPFARADALSDALGFTADGGVWVKDETNQVGGSHKGRHLYTILLHLRAAELLGMAPWKAANERPRLAIASCGNAAIAAATLAAASHWPLDVFVPEWADAAVLALLADLHATVTRCPRLDDDPPGDPALHRFREAVAAGSVPFTVQGPENALCLDGGRTLGWEIAEQWPGASGGRPTTLDRLFVQVGGGALASSVGAALGMTAVRPRLHAVQAQGCAPFDRAWRRAGDVPGGRAASGAHWAQCMTPWVNPHSAADGILDDEAYDWLGVVEALGSAGSPIVVPESLVIEAAELGPLTTGIDASPTGTAGLAGLLAARRDVDDGECVAVVFSGVRRAQPRGSATSIS
ncbi:MAG: PLP-dependent lyase/thiolase [Actinomycetota bacterium]|nr:MAG: PLP-dependent lyase/thiolase [Actinomycetota bacterium]